MAEGKDNPPSDARLSELRRSGEFPRSPVVLTFGVLLGASFLIPYLFSLFGDWQRRFAVVGLSEDYFISALLQIFAALVIIAGIVMFLGILQNRFYFRIPWMKPPEGKPSEPAKETPALERVSITLLWLGLFAMFFAYATSEVGMQIGVGRSESVERVANRFLALVLGFGFFTGVISFAGAWLRFRIQHSMSRAELESEGREGEMRPELRSAQRERSSS